MTRTASIVATLVVIALPTAAVAQDGGPGFLFERPSVTLGIKTGYTIPRADSDLFDFTHEQFRVNDWDFSAPYLGGEIAFAPADRWDVALGVGFSQSRRVTEYRDYVEQVGSQTLPIQQETTFWTVTGSLGAKYYLGDRGRRIGRFAWVPRRVTPFVGGGIGVASYEFKQDGDFIDYGTCVDVGGEEQCDIFTDRLRTRGTGFLVYATGGVDVSLTRNLFLTTEARYGLASAEVKGSYSGFDDLDLAGLNLLVGLGLKF